MPEKSSGPKSGLKGVVEDVKGKAKEATGVVTGRDDLEREVAKREAQADKARAEAEAHEAEQRANQ